MNVILLVLRLTIFPLFVFAVIFGIRNWQKGDRRQISSLIGGEAIALAATLSLVLSAVLSNEKNAVIQLVVMVPGALILWPAISVAIYAGQLLHSETGNYWFKSREPARYSKVILAEILSAMGILGFTLVISRSMHVPIAPFAFSSPLGVISFALSTLAFSFGEEFFYRGWIQEFLGSKLEKTNHGAKLSLLITSVIFTVQHMGGIYQVPIMLFAFLGGLVFGTIYRQYGMIAAGTVHMLANILTATALPKLASL